MNKNELQTLPLSKSFISFTSSFFAKSFPPLQTLKQSLGVCVKEGLQLILFQLTIVRVTHEHELIKLIIITIKTVFFSEIIHSL